MKRQMQRPPAHSENPAGADDTPARKRCFGLSFLRPVPTLTPGDDKDKPHFHLLSAHDGLVTERLHNDSQ